MQVKNIKRHGGIAGRFEVSAIVQYEGEKESRVSFVGSVWGGPVIAVSPSGIQTFVTDPDRFGQTLSEDWVRRFFQDLRDRDLVA